MNGKEIWECLFYVGVLILMFLACLIGFFALGGIP
jgi:hypothetical protein